MGKHEQGEDPQEIDIIGVPVFTEDDELGDVPEADMNGDQTDGMGPL